MSSKLDYLKRYMSKNEASEMLGEEPSAKKKKKKSKKEKHSTSSNSRFRIIDSDAFSALPSKSANKKSSHSDDEDEKYATREDLPLVAGVLDERPADVIMKEKFTTSGWQTNDTNNGAKIKEEPLSPDRRQPRVRHDSGSVSPPRRRHDSSGSEDNKGSRKRHDSDDSPPHKRHDSDASPSRKRHDSDASPPRRRHDSDASPSRKRHDSDASPPRGRHDSDASPPRRRHDSDASPPRRRHDSDASPPRRRHDSDASPPRKQARKGSPSDFKMKVKTEPSDDLSPPRQIKDEPYDSDMSPPRRMKQENEDSDISPPRRVKDEHDSDLSPPRPSDKNRLMSKTLSGKKAGLQNAKAMKEEMLELKKKEKHNFEKLGSEVSGRFAETKVRGRLKEKEAADKEKQEQNDKLRKELESKYQKWNKGLKQLEHEKAHIQSVLHEMDKPLARARDDEDLDAHLRDVDRQEDPMLAYVKKKKELKLKQTGVAITRYPEYKGPQPPPNRFNIRPGYRWDGVDRSNGFEKKLFEKANQRKASAEEAMRWSQEDM